MRISQLGNREGLFTRRSAVFGAVAALAVMQNGFAPLLHARSSDVADLKRFIEKSIGKSPAKRKRIAQETLDGINPLKGSELLELGALGVIARESSTSEALAEDIPRRSKRLIESLLKSHSGVAWAHAMTGAWHYEIVNRSRLAATFLGASRKKGSEQFDLARKNAAEDGGIYLLEAISLIYDKEDKKLGEIANLLGKAAAAGRTSGGAYGEKIVKHARELSRVAKTSGMSALANEVRQVF
ncbi:MAG: hypothetical protein WBA51_11735 [Erythrobacter sp.]